MDAAKLALGLFLFGYLIAQVQIQDLVGLKARLRIPVLFILPFPFFIGVGILAGRYWLLIGKGVSFGRILNLVVFQVVIGNTFSTLLGASSFAVTLNKRYSVNWGHGIGSLIFSRYLDILLSLLILVGTAVILLDDLSGIAEMLHFLIAVIGSGVVLLFLLFVYRRKLFDLVEKILVRNNLTRIKWLVVFRNMLGDLASYSVANDVRTVLLVSLSTIAITFLSLTGAYLNFLAFSMNFDPWILLFVLAVTQLINLIPIHVLGALGILEITQLFLFGLFGFQETILIPVLLGSRALFYLLNLILLIYLGIENLLAAKRLAEEEI